MVILQYGWYDDNYNDDSNKENGNVNNNDGGNNYDFSRINFD